MGTGTQFPVRSSRVLISSAVRDIGEWSEDTGSTSSQHANNVAAAESPAHRSVSDAAVAQSRTATSQDVAVDRASRPHVEVDECAIYGSSRIANLSRVYASLLGELSLRSTDVRREPGRHERDCDIGFFHRDKRW